jgi:type II secretory pathway component PulK
MPFAAAKFGTGQAQIGSQNPEEHAVSVDIQTDWFVIESEGNRVGHDVHLKSGFCLPKHTRIRVGYSKYLRPPPRVESMTPAARGAQ